MAKDRKSIDAFTVFTCIVGTLALGASIWLVLSLFHLKALMDKNAELMSDIEYARGVVIPKYPALIAGANHQGGFWNPNDPKPLDEHMRACGKNNGIIWQGSNGSPKITASIGPIRQAEAKFKSKGKPMVQLLQQLESLRTLSFITRFEASRASGPYAKIPGPADWTAEVTLRGPEEKKSDATTK